MTIQRMTSREFGENPDRAKEIAEAGPVFVADDGQSTHVLLSFDLYEKLRGRRSMSLAEAVADWGEGEDFEFDPPRIEGPIGQPADFS